MRETKQAGAAASVTYPTLVATTDGKTVAMALGTVGQNEMNAVILQTDDGKFGTVGTIKVLQHGDFPTFTGTLTLSN